MSAPSGTRSRRILEQVDSVYFLLFPGWPRELRSNRWHFVSRWARHKPVVLVSPTVAHGESTSRPEPRIPNCRLLDVQVVGEPNRLAKRHIQTGQVLADLAAHGHSAPLLWCYNPELLDPYSRIPAVARVHHASENYFAMPGPGAAFHALLRATIACSDVTVAVSEGVASALRREVEGAPIVTVPNGCDFKHYSAGTPDRELVERGRGYERIAIYGGNINARLDFQLLHRLALAHPRVLFALYGPVKDLPAAEMRAWRAVTALGNVRAPGAVDPDRLRDLYAASDVGIIPYLHERWLVENGLPLKALEMCATGLPVVASLMKPLRGLTSGVAVADSAEEFLSAFDRTSRASLAPEVAEDMRRVSMANDYDHKFDSIVEELGARAGGSGPVTRIDRMAASLGDEYVQAEARFARWLAMPLGLRVAAWFVASLARLLPTGVRRRLGATALRKRVRRLLGS